MINNLVIKFFNLFSFLLASLFFIVIITYTGMNEVNAATNKDLPHSSLPSVEYLRLSVPESNLNQWLVAEKETWEPWLQNKKGFMGRKMYWNKETQEATLLISWATRADWKNISSKEIADIQRLFEQKARLETGLKEGNPFPLTFEGELIPQ